MPYLSLTIGLLNTFLSDLKTVSNPCKNQYFQLDRVSCVLSTLTSDLDRVYGDASSFYSFFQFTKPPFTGIVFESPSALVPYCSVFNFTEQKGAKKKVDLIKNTHAGVAVLAGTEAGTKIKKKLK